MARRNPLGVSAPSGGRVVPNSALSLGSNNRATGRDGFPATGDKVLRLRAAPVAATACNASTGLLRERSLRTFERTQS
jgi:hypothetical protein